MTMDEMLQVQDMHDDLMDQIKRLREALQRIAIGGIGERNWTTCEMRAYARDALEKP